MSYTHNLKAPKNPTNASINSNLLKKAKSLKTNLPATLELALAEQLRREQQNFWLKENNEAIQAYNQFIKENGSFSGSTRRF